MVLSGKKDVSDLNDGDSIMADKGFYIEEDLKKVGIQLNIPPFPEEKNHSLMRMRPLKHTLLLTEHRINVERPSGKVGIFVIVTPGGRLPISSLGSIN